MTKIGAIFSFTLLFFNSCIQTKYLVGGTKTDRNNEDLNQKMYFENSGGYGTNYKSTSGDALPSLYRNYRPQITRRSLIDHRNNELRQTGIIYGDGKPIGILQPYQESFRFMPIREEKVYSSAEGRSNIEQPSSDPYLKFMMYPTVARFARNEDSVKISSEIDSSKAEFFHKNYPSMLVDFKIHNKLHPISGGQIVNTNFKRGFQGVSAVVDENNNKKKRENNIAAHKSFLTEQRQNQKREVPVEAAALQQKEIASEVKEIKRDTPSQFASKVDSKKLQKRHHQFTEKRRRQTNNIGEQDRKIENRSIHQQQQRQNHQKRDVSGGPSSLQIKQRREIKRGVPKLGITKQRKREDGKQKSGSVARKRETKKEMRSYSPQKRGTSVFTKSEGTQKRNVDHREKATRTTRNGLHSKKKKKRENNGLMTDVQFQKLKATIQKRHSNENSQVFEEDLRSLLNDMGLMEDEENRNGVVEDEEDFEESFGSPSSSSNMSKEKKESLEKIQEQPAQKIDDANIEEVEEAKKREVIQEKNSDLIAKQQMFMEADGDMSKATELTKRDFVIPNKRDVYASENKAANVDKKATKDENIEGKKRSNDFLSTTESYGEYEQRVAREIKNKIKQLKEEVKRELGALEDDDKDEEVGEEENEEEEEEGDSLGEPQRRKRFIPNTLMDEENHNIDPNENLESIELEPHVRRRRMLLSSENMDKSNHFEDINDETNSRMREANNNYNSYADGWLEPSMYHKRNKKRSKGDDDLFSQYDNNRNTMKNNMGSSDSAVISDDVNDNSIPNNFKDEQHNSAEIIDQTDLKKESKLAQHHQFHSGEHSPKKLPGYNHQKYYYYYLGNDKKDNFGNGNNVALTSSGSSSFPFRVNAIYPRMDYFYDTLNDNNDHQISMRNYLNSLSRPSSHLKQEESYGKNSYLTRQRRHDKRNTTKKNVFIPSRNTERAIVTNLKQPVNLKIDEAMIKKRTIGSISNLKGKQDIVDKNDIKELKKNHDVSKRAVMAEYPGKYSWYGRNYPQNLLSREGMSLFENLSKKKEMSVTRKKKSAIRNDKNVRRHFGISNSSNKQFKFPENSGRNANKFFWYWKDDDLEELPTETTKIPVRRNFNGILLNAKAFRSTIIPTSSTVNSPSQTVSFFDDEFSKKTDNNETVTKQNDYENEEYKCEDEAYDDKNVESTTDSQSNSTSEFKSIGNSTKHIDKNNNNKITNIHYNNNVILRKNNSFLSFGGVTEKRRKRDADEPFNHRHKRSNCNLWPSMLFDDSAIDLGEEEEENNDVVIDKNLRSNEEQFPAENRSPFLEDNDDEKDNYKMESNSFDRDKKQAKSAAGTSVNNEYRRYSSWQGMANRMNSISPISRERRYVENGHKFRDQRNPRQQLLSEISDVDLFGPLPQSYTGELARYKRVKKNDKEG